MKKYPNINEQIKSFGVYWVYSGKLVKIPIIKSVDDYSHRVFELHHYIREQMYYRYPERYEGEQKLILLPRKMHVDLHSGMRDETFLRKWKIERDLLLYRHRRVDAGFWDSNNEYKEEIR